MSQVSCKFGEFELDSARYELRRNGQPLKLERIPMELLMLLVEKDGSVVARQEIVERLWGKDVFLDTEHGINTAINKIRSALRDNPDRPRFIQTVSGKGYRFVAQKNGNGRSAALAAPFQTGKPDPPGAAQVSRRFRPLIVTAVVVFGLAIAALVALNLRGSRERIFAGHQIAPIHSIAVLPLVNLSGDPSQDYFADGMTDELITALAENRSLRIVSRTSAMQYKGVNKPLREIAQSLGVDGILEGSVNRSGNRVHANLQLIYAPADTHVWAHSYDRDLNQAMALPGEVSQTIATEAQVASSPAKVRRYINPEAHDAYLRGRYFYFGNKFEECKKSFEQATAFQPDYAAAWDGLADTYFASAIQGWIPALPAFETGKGYALKALELDDSLAEAHTSMAIYYVFHAWDLKQAEAESLRAIELNPNYAEAHFIYSFALSAMNRDEESLREQKRSTEIDPFARPSELGGAYIRSRDFDAAINDLLMRAKIQPQDVLVEFTLFEAYWFKGAKKEAGEHAQRMFSIEGDQQSLDALETAFKRGVDPQLGEILLRQDQERARRGYRPHMNLAWDYALLQRKAETLRNLDVAYHERSPWMPFLQKDPVFDFLHSDERFRALVRKVGLPSAY